MGIIGGRLGYEILRRIAPVAGQAGKETGDRGASTSVVQLFGEEFAASIRGKTVIDFGCGTGNQTVEMARMGARRVIGLDIQEHLLAQGRRLAAQAGVVGQCDFATSTDECVDVIISKDAFEHFADPAAILRIMAARLNTGGFVLAAFGPTWLHPYGGHLFSVFPWSHLLFTEHSQILWRSDFKSDGATRFSEVAGGLNQLTITAFERIVAESDFELEWLETVPIRGLALLKSRLLREIGSSIVRCKLRLKPAVVPSRALR